MDIIFIIIFTIVNLLPAKTQKCEVYVGNANNVLFSLVSKGKNEWHFKGEGKEEVRKFKITSTSIAEINPETGKAEDQNVNKYLELDKVKWKSVKKINLKEQATYLEIQREPKKIMLYKKGVDEAKNPLIIKY